MWSWNETWLHEFDTASQAVHVEEERSQKEKKRWGYWNMRKTTDKLRTSQFLIYKFAKLCIYPDVLSNSLSCYQTFTFGNTVMLFPWESILLLTTEHFPFYWVKCFCSRAPCQQLLNEFTVVSWQPQLIHRTVTISYSLFPALSYGWRLCWQHCLKNCSQTKSSTLKALESLYKQAIKIHDKKNVSSSIIAQFKKYFRC